MSRPNGPSPRRYTGLRPVGPSDARAARGPRAAPWAIGLAPSGGSAAPDELLRNAFRRTRPLRPDFRAARRGFSLLEMMLATAVLLGCVIVLGELAGMGGQHIDRIEGFSLAEVICQSTLGEMLSGAAAVESFEKREVEEHPGWMVSAELTPVDQPRLASLRVTAWYEDPNRTDLDPTLNRRHAFTLVRWVRDPDVLSPGREEQSTLVPFSLMDQIGTGGSP